MRHSQSLQLLWTACATGSPRCTSTGSGSISPPRSPRRHEVDRLSSFFDLVQQDPVVNRVKLIAEPWDVGAGGYQVGNFPACGRSGTVVPRLRTRLLAGATSRSPSSPPGSPGRPTSTSTTGGARASVNFVTAHDGFTLRDLVSYEAKRNEANGEGNQDGENDNRSWNCGAEGPTADQGVLELRGRQRRNFLATSCCRRASRCSRTATSWGAPARQQQRLLPGQRALLGRLGPRRGAARPGRLHPARDRAARRAPGPSQAPLLPRRDPDAREPAAARPGVAAARRPRDDGRGLAAAGRPRRRCVPQRRRHRGTRLPRQDRGGRLLPAAVEQLPGNGRLPTCRTARTGSGGPRGSTPRIRGGSRTRRTRRSTRRTARSPSGRTVCFCCPGPVWLSRASRN